MKKILEVAYNEKMFRIACCSVSLDEINDDIFSLLSKQERTIAESFSNDETAKEFAAGRYCAKEAFALYTAGIPENIIISIGVWGFPYVEGCDVNISISHTEKYIIAVCTGGAFPIGIDIEDHKTSNNELILGQLTDPEKKIIKVFPDYSRGLHILWTAKEAAAKALHTGFRLPMSLFEVSHLTKKGDTWLIEFDTLGVLSAIAIVTRFGVIALALPIGSILTNGFEEIS